jgi:hypothetical protein
MKFKILLCVSLYLLLSPAFAQTTDTLQSENFQNKGAPIPIELLVGNKAIAFQLIVSKQFSPKSRFGFFNVTTFSGDYEEKSQTAEFYSQSMITAEIYKGISIATGLSAIGSSNTPVTVRPTAGLQYLFTNKDFVLVLLPRFDLTQTYNFETFAVLEYKPSLSKNWGIYSRIQGLYNYNTNLKFHEVSSIYLRLGVSYKNVQFGLGTNLDFYGPDYDNVNNFGIFIKTDLL